MSGQDATAAQPEIAAVGLPLQFPHQPERVGAHPAHGRAVHAGQ
ncbi:hypothetical protein [Kitasatospora sp. NPDC004272]